jgi:2-oxoglutarate dehydrogenase E2 component (dihydrolipoamide succinyltransferase)
MSTEIKAPVFPESVADGTVATWHKKPGDSVKRDEQLVDIETDKVVLEVVAPSDGVLEEILKEEGDTVLSEEVVGKLKAGEGRSQGEEAKSDGDAEKKEAKKNKESEESGKSRDEDGAREVKASPAARKLAEEQGIDLSRVEPSGKGGLVTKEDVQQFQAEGANEGGDEQAAEASDKEQRRTEAASVEPPVDNGDREEKRVPMTRLRARIAERLLQATQSTAMLTTFNEVDMQPVMALRNQYKEVFEKTHNVRLGFMGFFVKAACEALKRFPGVNASIDGNDIVYHGFQDIGVAVSTDKGLVVPVLRDADRMGLAQIEDTVRDYGLRARDGKLSIDEIQGGTFTITNGGVFGSLLSTPIINPPQTAILGMHKIQERAVVIDGEIVVRPMMYLALSYDHRLIDGREAVQFLVTIKELIEDPARILLEI